jgi:hypothetical protein
MGCGILGEVPAGREGGGDLLRISLGPLRPAGSEDLYGVPKATE